MRRPRLLVAVGVAAAVLSGGGLAATAQGCPTLAGPWCSQRLTASALTASGPVRLDGTTASAAFQIGDRTIRPFRYADRRELGYSFALTNPGGEALTVVGVASAGPEATLLRVDRLERADTGRTRFSIPAAGRSGVRLVLDMSSCERVSSRAGSFLSHVTVRTRGADGTRSSTVVALPEELHTGSPREALCPRATSSSRSPG